METLSLDGFADVSLRARWLRHRRVLIPIIAAVFAVGAFLEWGPIGLGNGPLQMGSDTVESGVVSSKVPFAVVTPIRAGSPVLVIDRVQLLGNGSYPAPHLLAMEAMSYTDCGDGFPVRTTAAGFVLEGCGGRPLGTLYGRPVGSANSPIVFAAFKIRAPRPGSCWLMTHIVTHYHVGIRHWVATDRYFLAVCAGSSDKAQKIADAAAGIAAP